MSNENQKIDPNLADFLWALTRLANIAGAEGVFLIRGAKTARLIYYLDPPENCPYCGSDDTTDLFDPTEDVIDRFKCQKCKQIFENPPVNFAIADAAILVVMRFLEDDGGESGIEMR